MSFARPRLLMGLSPRLHLAAPSLSLRSSLAHRLMSTSTRSLAQYAPGPATKTSHDGLTSDIENRSSRVAPRHEPIFDAQGNELDPYKGGPSAIDKAVHLFFFTEIIRGSKIS